jgi:hypothetical protein
VYYIPALNSLDGFFYRPRHAAFPDKVTCALEGICKETVVA